MKKLILQKKSALVTIEPNKTKEYKIPYHNELNTEQYEAVMHTNGAALVIAGAGTGKTRTLVYRVARLVEDGVPPEQILLLTFTKKSSAEMLRRASQLLDGRCDKVSGGTFHSFAHQLLRKYAAGVGIEPNFSILDQSDAEDTINLLRAQLGLEKSKRTFPQKQTLIAIYSASINRCIPVEKFVETHYPRFTEEIPQIQSLIQLYIRYKRQHNLMDYDDLLVYLLSLLQSPKFKNIIQNSYRYLMVDEYQDTNSLQHQIVVELAGSRQNVMAVGDDAQSIYSFRGANYQNIFNFPKSFKDCKVITIARNYRSTQMILEVANEIIRNAGVRYEKELVGVEAGNVAPIIVSMSDERQQSLFVVQQIIEARENGIPLTEIAVLFRSGYMSFDLEIELNRANIPFRKFGGLKFIESAHIKDLIAFYKCVYNPLDVVAWHRILLLLEGVGARTAAKIIDDISNGHLTLKDYSILKNYRSSEGIVDLFDLLKRESNGLEKIGNMAVRFAEFYRPILKKKYDDFAKRWKDIEMFLGIAERYTSLATFLADMALDSPIESTDVDPEDSIDEYVTLSTIHSAKGLEWNTVFIIWALDGKFPSSKSIGSLEDTEEERRLLYVAVTRAKSSLFITYPTNIYDRETGFVLGSPSRFLDSIGEEVSERYVLVEENE
ncbi:MAG: ATP-dependent helicase [Ignavibacteriae bacterium]|nr:ATP-dependent helicase [Ignavibacteriota bacterium]